MKSVHEQMLDVWAALGGKLADHSGPAWAWRPNPTPEQLLQLLSHAPVDLT